MRMKENAYPRQIYYNDSGIMKLIGMRLDTENSHVEKWVQDQCTNMIGWFFQTNFSAPF